MNKRLLTLLLALVVMTVSAVAENYGIYVAGVQVTSDNASDLTKNNSKIQAYSTSVNNGKPYAKFDKSTNTLTLWNVKISTTGSGDSNRSIYNKSYSGSLIIVLKGINSFSATSVSPLRFEKSTTIKGEKYNSTMRTDVSGGTEDAVTVRNSSTSLTISGATLKITSNSTCFESEGDYPTLKITNASITATCNANKSDDCYALKKYGKLSISNSTVELIGYNQAIIGLKGIELGTGQKDVLTPGTGLGYGDLKKNESGEVVFYAYSSSGPIIENPKKVTFQMSKKITSTLFPDANFLTYVSSSSIDKNQDNYLSKGEIMSIKTISVPNKSIGSLTGIELFSELTSLDCPLNNLTSLNVFQNGKLETLNCAVNKLTSLTLPALTNTKLKELECYLNQIDGTAMWTIIDNLPTVSGGVLKVFSDNSAEGNFISSAQVTTAKNKGWTVQKLTDSNSWVSYTGASGVEINSTNFPDENFRNYLYAQDYGKDGFLTTTEVKAVTELDVNGKSISNLKGVENFTALKKLYCYNNSLSSLDVSKLTALEELKCYLNSKLNTLDVSKNTKLTILNVRNNGMTSLNVSKNTALTSLNCRSNNLTALDVSKNTKLEKLWCYTNSLTTLTVTNNTALNTLHCYGNKISGSNMDNLINSLPTKTSSNQGTFVVVGENLSPDNIITTGQVTTAKNKYWKVQKYDGSSYVNYDGAVEINATNFPDENFRNHLLSQDYGEDGILTEEEIEAVKNLNLSKKGIKDLTGIEYFTALTELHCDGNSLESLDVSKNTLLTFLDCAYNSLESLDVSKNTALTKLECEGNSLESLDVSKNTALTTLSCYSNSLMSLDVSKNTALTELVCTENSLASLDVSKNTALTELYCYGNSLTSLDVSKNTLLTFLDCAYNSLTSLDVSKNTALTKLECEGNSLESLDVSKNTALTELVCTENSLTSLDVSKNTALTKLICYKNSLESLDVSKNTALTTLYCYGNQIEGSSMDNLVNSLPTKTSSNQGTFVVVGKNLSPDNIITTGQITTAKNKYWKVQKYDGSSYVDYDGGVEINATNFPDENFRNYLLSTDRGKDGILTDQEIQAITKMDVSDKEIKNLKGIEYFTALTDLWCYFNSLESLDVSKNTALTVLKCYSNSLKSLDVSKNTALTVLMCYSNSLTSLDVSKNTALTELNCSRNSLTSLDVSKNTALTMLDCGSNLLKTLDVSKNTALTKLVCYKNQLSSLDLSKNTKLVYLTCYLNKINGSQMDALIASLPTVSSGQFWVYVYSDGTELNECTKNQVAAAEKKGWTVYTYNTTNLADSKYLGRGSGDLDHNGKVDKNDLDILVNHIMGKFTGKEKKFVVNGNVVDEYNEAVIGASVRVEGTNTGTVTDFNGNFTLQNVKEGTKLIISYIGYGYQPVTVTAAPIVKVTLQEEDSAVKSKGKSLLIDEDLNNDGVVDAADVVTLVNILK